MSTLDQLQGQFSNLRVRKLIDEGASSQVWEGDWAGARVVIKVLREQEALRSFLSEVNIWRQLRHPCVCALLGVCMFEGRPSMVLEYMTGGSLHDLLHNATERTELDPLLLARVVSEVASGVAYLHSYGVMHRDVKVCGCPVSSPHSRANLSHAAPCATPPPPSLTYPTPTDPLSLPPLPPSPLSLPPLSLPLPPSPSPSLSPASLRRRPTCCWTTRDTPR